MDKIIKFILKDVRCFEGEQEFNIRPLTFLTGENSTGKSTVLGCMQALGNFADLNVGVLKPFSLDFNVEPYKLGTFADIARKNNKGIHPRKRFSLGFEARGDTATIQNILVTFVEREDGSEPRIEKLNLGFDDGHIVLKLKKQHDEIDASRRSSYAPEKSIGEDGKPIFEIELSDATDFGLSHFYFGLFTLIESSSWKQSKGLAELIEFVDSTSPDPYTDIRFESFAPIRSKPMRTYDPVREVKDPEGGGMPMTLINIYRKSPQQWDDLRKKLVKFGKASGLFTDVDIKKIGDSVSDPFQIQVKARGLQSNMIDVGYGVSQILPVLVRIFNAEQPTVFLIQQPEVHLHPRAQAELCSLLIEVAKKYGHSFVIETHSDYMVNRARFHIMKKGGISKDDVSLIYLEPATSKVTAHNITFDECANFIDLPDGYGEFFLKESNKVLGFED